MPPGKPISHRSTESLRGELKRIDHGLTKGKFQGKEYYLARQVAADIHKELALRKASGPSKRAIKREKDQQAKNERRRSKALRKSISKAKRIEREKKRIEHARKNWYFVGNSLSELIVEFGKKVAISYTMNNIKENTDEIFTKFYSFIRVYSSVIPTCKKCRQFLFSQDKGEIQYCMFEDQIPQSIKQKWANRPPKQYYSLDHYEIVCKFHSQEILIPKEKLIDYIVFRRMKLESTFITPSKSANMNRVSRKCTDIHPHCSICGACHTNRRSHNKGHPR